MRLLSPAGALLVASALLAEARPARPAPLLNHEHNAGDFASQFPVASNLQRAQTFTNSLTGLLTRVELQMSKLAAATGDVTVALRRTNGVVPIDGEPLFETTVPLTDIQSGLYGLALDVSSNGLLVRTDEMLAVTLTRGVTTQEAFFHAGGPAYSGGAAYMRTSDSESWTAGPTSDFGVRTWVDPAVRTGTLTLSPTVDSNISLIGGGWSIDSTVEHVAVHQLPAASIDRRGIMEFDLRAIPAGVKITDARLKLDVRGLQLTHFEFAAVPFFAYTGDGVASIDDAVVRPYVLGITDPIDSVGPTGATLNANFINDFYHSGQRYLGLLALGPPEGEMVFFYSTEDAANGDPPALELTYELPSQLPGDFDENGVVNSQDLGTWRQAFGFDARADADGDGDSDGNDFLLWQRNLNIPAESPAAEVVPEPSGSALTASVALAVHARRWLRHLISRRSLPPRPAGA
jgi:hypothetical protein